MQRARSFGVTQQPAAHGRLRRCLCRVRKVANHAEINEAIQHHVTKFDRIVAALGAGAAVQSAQNTEEIKARLLQEGPKLAKPPKHVPVTKSLHVVRNGKVDRVCKILGGDGGPAVAALTGRSGAGKTTAATTMVGERGPIRPLAGETEDQARTRLDRVRALFPGGVVWLRVGKGQGAADRLPSLMLKLAKRVHEDVMDEGVDPPAAREDGESYVKKIASQESLRCLVVADDVWEPSVVEKLRKTGMWVLLTTRFPEMVEPNERVVMDTLTEAEAEDVLRGAAELPPGESLCDGAKEVLKICGRVAMDIAFVGSWSSVRTADNEAWASAVSEINIQIDAVKQVYVGNPGEVGDRESNRLAVLRAGFKYLGREDPLVLELYVALAVFPDGHSFKDLDAAVLLNDQYPPADHHVKLAMRAIEILGRWAVLGADTSGLYRVHDAHVNFAKGKLMGREDIRKSAVGRWIAHISRLDFAVDIDMYALLDIWRAQEEVEGRGWFDYRPYDDQLVQMDASDPLTKVFAVSVVAEMYAYDRKFPEMEALMRKVLEHGDGHGADCSEVQMAVLYSIRRAVFLQGRFQEMKDVDRRIAELDSLGLELKLPSEGTGFLQMSRIFSMYGGCAVAAGRPKDAEEWFRKALRALVDGGLTASYQTAWVMCKLAGCVREAGRPGEAEELFRRELKIREAKLGPDDLQIAVTLHEMSLCVQEAGRLGEAEKLLKRALEIKEVKLRPDDLQVAYTLHQMGRCVREAGRPGDAKELFRRALEIGEAKLGPDDVAVAYTLHEMGVCAREAGRPGEAEAWLKRALKILEAKSGRDDLQVVHTLHEMGVCAREAGRLGDAEALFQRAGKIKEAKT
ncbi:unnamed protein product [Ectocarpus sp. 12 AP-2014]